MNKKITILILIVLVIGLAMGGYYFWKNRVSVETPETKVVNELQEVTESITESVVQGSTIPSLGDTTKVTNPLENVQDTNPYSNTNPFSDIKVNPFE